MHDELIEPSSTIALRDPELPPIHQVQQAEGSRTRKVLRSRRASRSEADARAVPDKALSIVGLANREDSPATCAVRPELEQIRPQLSQRELDILGSAPGIETRKLRQSSNGRWKNDRGIRLSPRNLSPTSFAGSQVPAQMGTSTASTCNSSCVGPPRS